MVHNHFVRTAPSTDEPRPRTWERAWHEALYGPDGFYRTTTAGRHFATSVQGIPGGGEVLAAAVVTLARRHGCSRVVDVGAGGGELLARVRALEPGLHLTGVDVVGRGAGTDGNPADLVRDGADAWLRSPGGAALPDDLAGLTDTLVVAHEWLDVVPCPVVVREDGVWREVTVRRDGTEVAGAPLDPSAPSGAWLERWVPAHVARAEVGLARDRAAADLLGRLGSGVLLLVDYAHVRGTRPPHGTLTAFRDGREVEPVPDGSCDLTAHVAVDSLVEHLSRRRPVARADVVTQREALADLLPAASEPVPHELARSAPAAYLRALAGRSALRALCAPGGLGDFSWVTVVLPRTGTARQ